LIFFFLVYLIIIAYFLITFSPDLRENKENHSLKYFHTKNIGTSSEKDPYKPLNPVLRVISKMRGYKDVKWEDWTFASVSL
jgi:hypothetical protein